MQFHYTSRPGLKDGRPSGALASSLVTTRSDSVLQVMTGLFHLFGEVVKESKSMDCVITGPVDFTTRLRVQQVTFENGCKLFLYPKAKSKQEVENMLESRDNPVWTDTIAGHELDAMMASFCDPSRRVLEGLWQTLSELMDRILSTRTHNQTENLLKLLNNLIIYNSLFYALIRHAMPKNSSVMLEPSIAKGLIRQFTMQTASTSNSHVYCVQRASRSLFGALSGLGMSYKHGVQTLSVSLDIDSVHPARRISDKGPRFDVAVTISGFDGPYRLDVDSSQCIYCTCQKFKESGSWCGQEQASNGNEQPRQDSVVIPDLMQNGIRLLSWRENICESLQDSHLAVNESKDQMERSYLGSFRTKDGFKSLCYFSLDHGESSFSLDDALAHAEKENRPLPIEDRLRVALSLAMGVLHLHSSSWLSRTWTSRNVRFFDVQGFEKQHRLGTPFFQNDLEAHSERQPGHESILTTVRYSILLNLGLVLLELAFSAPYRQLQLPADVVNKWSESEKDSVTLNHLCENVSKKLGTRFAKVVRTCLSQILGPPELLDLGEPEVEEILSKAVIKELEACLSVVVNKSGKYGCSLAKAFIDRDRLPTVGFPKDLEIL